MECHYCKMVCIKSGRQRNGKQRYYCKCCKKHQQVIYKNKAYSLGINDRIIQYTKESCGVRSISRILKISAKTVMSRIKKIASKIETQ